MWCGSPSAPVKGGQGRGQGSNLRGHLPGSCEVRVLFGTGRENPAQKNPLDLGHQLGLVTWSSEPAKQGVRVRDVRRMGGPKVDLPPHGHGWGGSNAPAPTQATLRMRVCASQGPMLECGRCEELSARRGGRTRRDVRVRARWGRTRSKTGRQLTTAAPPWG